MPDEFPQELTPDVLQQINDLLGMPRPARIPLVHPSKEAENGIDVTGEKKTDPKPLPGNKGMSLILLVNPSKARDLEYRTAL